MEEEQKKLEQYRFGAGHAIEATSYSHEVRAMDDRIIAATKDIIAEAMNQGLLVRVLGTRVVAFGSRLALKQFVGAISCERVRSAVKWGSQPAPLLSTSAPLPPCVFLDGPPEALDAGAVAAGDPDACVCAGPAWAVEAWALNDSRFCCKFEHLIDSQGRTY